MSGETDELSSFGREAFARLVKILGRRGLTEKDVEHLLILNESIFSRAEERKGDKGRALLYALAKAFEKARAFKGESYYAGSIAHWFGMMPRHAVILMQDWAGELGARPMELRTKMVRHYSRHGFTVNDRTAKATADTIALVLLASGFRSEEDDFETAFAHERAAVKDARRSAKKRARKGG